MEQHCLLFQILAIHRCLSSQNVRLPSNFSVFANRTVLFKQNLAVAFETWEQTKRSPVSIVEK
jgi:hypothetical protein